MFSVSFPDTQQPDQDQQNQRVRLEVRIQLMAVFNSHVSRNHLSKTLKSFSSYF